MSIRKKNWVIIAFILVGAGYFLLNKFYAPISSVQKESNRTSLENPSNSSSLFENFKKNLPSDKIVIIEGGKVNSSLSRDYYKVSESEPHHLFDYRSTSFSIDYTVQLKDLIDVPKSEFYSAFFVRLGKTENKTLDQLKTEFYLSSFQNLSDKPELKEDSINGHRVLVVRFYALPFGILIMSQFGNDVEILDAEFNLNTVQGRLNRNSSKSQMDMYEAYLKSLIIIDSKSIHQ